MPNQCCGTLWRCIQGACLCQHKASRFNALVFMPHQEWSGSYHAAEHSVFLESLLALLQCGALRESVVSAVVSEWISPPPVWSVRGVHCRDTPRLGQSYKNLFRDCSQYLHHPCFFAIGKMLVSFRQTMENSP